MVHSTPRSRCPAAALLAFTLLITAASRAVSHAAPPAPLRSPWSGHPVPLTGAPYTCPALPNVTADLTTDSFYRKDDPTHSIVDPLRMEAYRESAEPVKTAGQQLVKAADAYRATGSRAAAQCVLSGSLTLARNAALTGHMSSSQACYVQGWIAGAWAIANLKIADSGLVTPEDHKLIVDWLVQVGKSTRDWYDLHAAQSHKPEGNNHLYWAGIQLAATGVLADNRGDYDWGLATYENGVAQIAPDGTLKLEMARGTRALHYHLYALAPLVLMAEFAAANNTDLYASHNGAIHRLVHASVYGIDDPSLFVKATGIPQEFEHPASGDAIGWAPPYLRRFPDPVLARLVKQAPSLSVFYLGGLPPQ